MKKWLSCLMACLLTMIMAGAAGAEDLPDFDAMLPLVDLTASAALRVSETPENISADEVLSTAFVQNFFLLGQSADAALGITPELLEDPAAQAEYLKNAFNAGRPQLGELEGSITGDYIGMQIMASRMNDQGDEITLYGDLYQAEGPLASLTEEAYLQASWLRHRAVVTLVKAANAPGGWKIDEFRFEAAFMTEDAQASLAPAMAEYVNSSLGFSLQYPAVFMEAGLTEETHGVHASLGDGSAAFFARLRSNDSGAALEVYVAELQSAYSGAEAIINEVSKTGRVTSRQADGHIRVDLLIVTEAWIYEAQLCYAPELAGEFGLYTDYMTNSFVADELGIG